MRLWHEELISILPRQQLLGQHRECCALRGNGWDKKHSTVNYVFKYHPLFLYAYHTKIMIEMKIRGYKVADEWISAAYRGKKCKEHEYSHKQLEYLSSIDNSKNVYQEHNDKYYLECIDNLKKKGIEIDVFRKNIESK
jgi:uncharacterized protein (TIGR02328 family)